MSDQEIIDNVFANKQKQNERQKNGEKQINKDEWLS